MKYLAAILLTLMVGCSTIQHGHLDEPQVNRGYHDPFDWVGKLTGVVLPLSFAVDAVFVVPIAAILDRPFYEWFPITKAVFRCMEWNEAVYFIEGYDITDYSDWPEVEPPE